MKNLRYIVIVFSVLFSTHLVAQEKNIDKKIEQAERKTEKKFDKAQKKIDKASEKAEHKIEKAQEEASKKLEQAEKKAEKKFDKAKDKSENALENIKEKKEKASKNAKKKFQKENAYGKNKGELSGREFGQARAAEARQKLEMQKVSLQEKELILTNGRQKIDNARLRLEAARKAKKYDEAEVKVFEEKIGKAQQKLNDLENSILKTKEVIDRERKVLSDIEIAK